MNRSITKDLEVAVVAEFAFCGDKKLFIFWNIFLNVLTEFIHMGCFFSDLPGECLNVG